MENIDWAASRDRASTYIRSLDPYSRLAQGVALMRNIAGDLASGYDSDVLTLDHPFVVQAAACLRHHGLLVEKG